jgi:hypothetical protein
MGHRTTTFFFVLRSFVLLLLALALGLPARAQVPDGWTAADLGNPLAPGLTAVDGSAIWHIRGSGRDVCDNSGQFQFCYRPFYGYGSISARILSQDGGNPNWAKTGLMFRENDTAGGRNVNYVMTSGAAGHETFRPTARQGSGSLGGNLFPRTFPLFLRLQRVGQEFTGYYSDDGVLWRQAAPSVTVSMPDLALVGLSATAHDDGSIVAADFDRVEVRGGVASVGGLQACGTNGRILVSWNPISVAAGYNVYRIAASADGYRMTRLNNAPLSSSSFTDDAAGLVNGIRVLYAVTPLLRRVAALPEEGPAVLVAGTPIDVPGLFGCSIGETLFSGVAAFDAAAGTLTVRGSGADITDIADQFYFAARTGSGNLTLSVKVPDLPTAANGEARAGIMLRESLDAGSRNAMLYISPTNGVGFQYRRDTGGGTQRRGQNVVPPTSVSLPIWLRLERRAGVVTAYTSTDGTNYDSRGTVTFRPPLSDTLYAGLAVTAHDARGLAEARFQSLDISPAQ